MNPKQFLQIGGVVLVLVGILGFVGVIGPTAESSLFGGAWWFDNAENWAHLVLGVVALGSKMVDPPVVKRALRTMQMAEALALLATDWRSQVEVP
ncbi:MAG: hypothetical protein AAB650_00555, partial [Patescibacteria group bacterium]